MPKRKRGLVASLPRKDKHSSVSSSRQHGGQKSECDDDTVSVWVQCENEKCQKWRRISSELASNLKDSPWYCWLNHDARFNSCSASEEKARKPKHMKFIYSLLPLGEVVTAKLSGYPTWPGLLTQDPTCGEYYDAPLDKETEITHYHVEFFGQPRSRAWLVPALVHPLRSMSEADKAPLFRNIQGRQLAELKRSYEVALEEARVSLSMASCERLERCHFKYDEENDKPAMSADRVNELKMSLKASQSVTRQVRSSPSSIPGMNNKIARKKNNSVETSQSWKEKDFLIRLQSFAAERGTALPKQPVWRGKRISLFDFYNLVLQHGGFENICRRKLWNKVYNELLQSSVIYGGMSTAARVFYQKNLMPFEHHMRSHKTVDIQFVPDEVSSLNSAERPGRKRSREEKRSCSSLGSLEGEQAVPEVAAIIESTCHKDGTLDQVPSSNPDSPRRSPGSCSFESDDDDSTTFGCDMVEKELQQLERLLSSLEPSLYPETDGDEFVKVSGSQKEPASSVFQAETWNQSLKGVDVLKTLDEMARIEGAIADLNSLVSLELDKL